MTALQTTEKRGTLVVKDGYIGLPGVPAENQSGRPAGDEGHKPPALVPPLQGGASREYRFWPVLRVKPVPMIFPLGEDVGALLFVFALR